MKVYLWIVDSYRNFTGTVGNTKQHIEMHWMYWNGETVGMQCNSCIALSGFSCSSKLLKLWRGGWLEDNAVATIPEHCLGRGLLQPGQ